MTSFISPSRCSSDGMVAQAVDIVTERGVPYFSSAGNQARDSYEKRVSRCPNSGDQNLNGGKAVVRRFHNFGTGPRTLPSCSQCSCSPTRRGRLHDLQFPVGSTAPDRNDLRAHLKAGPGPGARRRRATWTCVFLDHKGHVIRALSAGRVAAASPASSPVTATSAAMPSSVAAGLLGSAERPRSSSFIGIVLNAGPDPGLVKHAFGSTRRASLACSISTRRAAQQQGRANSAGPVHGFRIVVCHGAVHAGRRGAADRHADARAIDLSPCAPACLNDDSSAGSVPILLRPVWRHGSRNAGDPSATRA